MKNFGERFRSNPLKYKRHVVSPSTLIRDDALFSTVNSWKLAQQNIHPHQDQIRTFADLKEWNFAQNSW